MAVSIGIYEHEDEVLEGIRLLRNAGVEQGEIRIVVGNREDAPILTSNADVPLEELYAIQETRRESGDGIGMFPLGAAPLSTGYPAGNPSISFGGPTGVIFTSRDDGQGPTSKEVLTDIGIPKNAAEECGKAVDSGNYLLIAEADSDINLEALLRNAGASNVVH